LASPAKTAAKSSGSVFFRSSKNSWTGLLPRALSHSHKILLQIPLGVNIKFDVKGKFYMLIIFCAKMPALKQKKAHHLYTGDLALFYLSILKTLPMKDAFSLYSLIFLGLIFFYSYADEKSTKYLSYPGNKKPRSFFKKRGFQAHGSHFLLTLK
jgi:hypothetical protein